MKLFIKTALFVSFLLLSIPVVVAGTHQDVGTNTAQSLEFELGARPAGMGGAFVALADDANALYWNPAGISQVKNVELNPSQVQHFEDISCNYIGFIYPLDEMRAANIKDLGALGFGMSLFDMGNFVGRDDTGTHTGDFSAKDRVINISYGKYVGDNLSLGVAGKFIAQEIEAYKAEGYVFDIGGLYNTPIKGFNLGFCVQNLGAKMKFIQEENELPLKVKFGFAYRMFKKHLTLALDVNKPSHSFYSMNAGIEWLLADVIALRTGYKSRCDEGSGITAGAGLTIKEFDFSFMPVKEIVFDYAFTPYGDLGNAQQVSLMLKLGVD